MKQEVIIGILAGYVLWRWFSGQPIIPSFTKDEEDDSGEFDFEEDGPIYTLS